MENHLLEYIEIKDFKCFKNFKAEGFKRVNLIGGKNNVGKTAFMEACYVNVHSKNVESTVTAITGLTYRRNNLEFMTKEYTTTDDKAFLENIGKLELISNYNDIKFEIFNNAGIKGYIFNINSEITSLNINEFSFEEDFISTIEFIDNFGLTNSELKDVFISVQQKDQEENLYKYINDFDDNILNFKILGGEKPSCKVIDRDEYQDISEFGDGLKHYISIICSLYACENGYLFIDEIDNGIHYTQLDRLWEIILTISKEQNVQVFATTHSKECIESYARVSKKLEEKKEIEKDGITFIELGKDKENKLDSIVMDSERLQRHLSQGNEVRGW